MAAEWRPDALEDRRRFLAALVGGLAAVAGCASTELTGPAGDGTAPSPGAGPGTVHPGPAATARVRDPSPAPPSTTAVEVTATGTVTVMPTEDDDGGSPDGGAGSAPSAPSGPTARTATVTPAEPVPSAPLRLTLSSVTAHRVVGDLTCTAGPLAWMAVDVGFLRDGEPVETERRRRDGPGTGETLAFDVESGATDLDGVRLQTAFAYPAP